MNVIFVSNSPVVLDKELGKKIDSFDIVIRCNDFEIDGYEKYVGTKTDIWASCSGPPWLKDHPLMRISHWMDFQKDKLGPFKEVWTVREQKSDDLFQDNKEQLKNFVKGNTVYRYMHKKKIDGKLQYVSKFVADQVNKLKPATSGKVSPSTGFLTILTALEQFGEITVYGNSFFKDKQSMTAKQSRSSRLGKHYFTMDISKYKGTPRQKYFETQIKREKGGYAILDYDTETKIVESFIKSGRVKLL